MANMNIREAREIANEVAHGTFRGTYDEYRMAFSRLHRDQPGTRSRPNMNHLENLGMARLLWNKVGEVFPDLIPKKPMLKDPVREVLENAVKVITSLSDEELILATVDSIDLNVEALERAVRVMIDTKLRTHPLSEV